MAFAEPYTAVDVEDAVREWGRSVLTVPVFFGVNNKAAFPQITLQRIRGPDDDCLIQFDVWGGSKKQAADVASDLGTALNSLSPFDHDGMRLHGAEWTSTRWLPDENSGRSRYIVEATFTATSTTAVVQNFYGGGY